MNNSNNNLNSNDNSNNTNSNDNLNTMDDSNNTNSNDNLNSNNNNLNESNTDLENNDVMMNKNISNDNNISEKSSFILSDKEVDKKWSESKRISMPFLTKYEKAKIIGLRTQQLVSNALPMINTKGLKNNLEIALEELRQKKTPFIIKRVMPNNKCEYWKIDELIQI